MIQLTEWSGHLPMKFIAIYFEGDAQLHSHGSYQVEFDERTKPTDKWTVRILWPNNA